MVDNNGLTPNYIIFPEQGDILISGPAGAPGASPRGAALTLGPSGYILASNGTSEVWIPYSNNQGTVTRVSLLGTNGIATSGGPITSTGTINVSLLYPTLIQNAGNVTGTIDVASGSFSLTAPAATGTVSSITLSSSAHDLVLTGTNPITTSGTIDLELATQALIPGSYGVPSITVNSKGIITAIASGNVSTNNIVGNLSLSNFNSGTNASATTFWSGTGGPSGNGAWLPFSSITGFLPISGGTITSDLVISGNLTVNGTTTTINTATLDVADINITMGNVSIPSDATANGGGIQLLGATTKSILWANDGFNAWTSSENFNLVTGRAYMINDVSVLNATTLGVSVVNSSLTSVGTLSNLTVTNPISGSITGQSGTVATISGLISAGSNITITGSGTSGSPYSISGTAGGVTSFTGDGVILSNSLSTGAVTATLETVANNLFLAGPLTGGPLAPTYRLITAADVPTLNQNTTGTAANITATSNSTLTTLSSLSLPGSQVTGNISGQSGTVATISGLITQGSNITITGSGTTGSPYNISATLAAPSSTLLTAANFAVLAGAAVTNTGSSVVTGDVGATSAITPGAWTVTGTVHTVNDAATQQAIIDATSAYNTLSVLSSTVLTGDLGGKTLTHGVYSYPSSAGLTGTLTLDFQGLFNQKIVIITGSTLTTASASVVNVINSNPTNAVYWVIGSSATLGTTTSFDGIILAHTSITLTTGVTIANGSALAITGSVTMDTNTITIPVSSGSGIVTSGTAGQVAYYNTNGATVSGESLSALMNSSLGATQGDILYQNGTNWVVLAPGTSGQVLTTGGVAANPAWMNVSGSGTVTSVTFTGDGTVLSSTPSSAVTTSGTVTASLASAANNTILSNISGASASPSYNSITSIIDKLGATQGDILYRNATGWVALTPGTSGQFLTTGGASANPSWTTASGSGSVTNIATGSGLTGGPITTTGTISVATNGITNSLFRQSGANTLVGNNTGSTANVTDITLGGTLSLLSSALTTTALTGDITSVPGSFNATVTAINTVSLGSTTATAGNLLIGSGSQWVTHAVSGDATLGSSGVLLVTKTNGTSFAASATTDTTNASNISTGSLALARISTIANNTLLGNSSGATAAPSAQTDAIVSGGHYAKGTLTGSYTDGIVMDYTAGTGRISVGASDNIVFYNGGVASTALASISSNSLTIDGSTSGAVSINTQAAAGTYNFNLPTTAGTAGQVLTSQGGGSTAMTWTSGGGVTFPLAAPNDSATAPSYSFSNSTNTGMFYAGSNNLGFSSNGKTHLELIAQGGGTYTNYVVISGSTNGNSSLITTGGTDATAAGLGLNISTQNNNTNSNGGGTLSLLAGNALGASSSNGGSISLTAGQGGNTGGAGGGITLQAGGGGGTGHTGGSISIIAGYATSGTAGSLTLQVSNAGATGATFIMSNYNTALTLSQLQIGTVGYGLSIKEGANAKQGLSAAMTAGSITISTTAVTTNSRIHLTINVPGGTVGSVYVSSKTAGTGFTITSTSSTDTSQVAWMIVEAM